MIAQCISEVALDIPIQGMVLEAYQLVSIGKHAHIFKPVACLRIAYKEREVEIVQLNAEVTTLMG